MKHTIVTTDQYQDFVENVNPDIEKRDVAYRDAYYDGAYDLFLWFLEGDE